MFSLYTLAMMFNRAHKDYMEIKKQQDLADSWYKQYLKSLQWEGTKLMTRKEAIEKWNRCEKSVHWIDFFIEAGMLKVDEEKSVEQKAVDMLEGYGFKDIRTIIRYINEYGFKIVEK